ncbi:MAG: Ig-like domain-containing protein [Gemmatimonadaceae bacterium]|nr:Ig-like domain-containing protein [Gemmatimonadaceae bacterium]
MKPALIFGVALAGFTTACGCDADLQSRFDPSTKLLAVGESFTPSVKILGCGGTEPLRDVVTWAATDSSVVRVDAATGRTTALRTGSTFVRATGQTYYNVGGIAVTVR